MASHVQFGVLDHLSDIPGGLQGGTPLVFFDRNTRDTIVLSPSSNFMDTSQATWMTSKGERVIGFGPIGSIKQVTDREFVFFVTYQTSIITMVSIFTVVTMITVVPLYSLHPILAILRQLLLLGMA